MRDIMIALAVDGISSYSLHKDEKEKCLTSFFIMKMGEHELLAKYVEENKRQKETEEMG